MVSTSRHLVCKIVILAAHLLITKHRAPPREVVPVWSTNQVLKYFLRCWFHQIPLLRILRNREGLFSWPVFTKWTWCNVLIKPTCGISRLGHYSNRILVELLLMVQKSGEPVDVEVGGSHYLHPRKLICPPKKSKNGLFQQGIHLPTIDFQETFDIRLVFPGNVWIQGFQKMSIPGPWWFSSAARFRKAPSIHWIFRFASAPWFHVQHLHTVPRKLSLGEGKGNTSKIWWVAGFITSWWLNQPIWTIFHSQISSFPQESGWTQKMLKLPPPRSVGACQSRKKNRKKIAKPFFNTRRKFDATSKCPSYYHISSSCLEIMSTSHITILGFANKINFDLTKCIQTEKTHWSVSCRIGHLPVSLSPSPFNVEITPFLVVPPKKLLQWTFISW